MKQLSAVLAISLAVLTLTAPIALAASSEETDSSGSEFPAGSVISDEDFFDPGAMSETEIEGYLRNHPSVCGENADECLENRNFAINWLPVEGMGCTLPALSGTASASAIIFDAAQACRINPQVLLVITENIPQEAEADFSTRIYDLAQSLRSSSEDSEVNEYLAAFETGVPVVVENAPAKSCGSEEIAIANSGTAALYAQLTYLGGSSDDGCEVFGAKQFHDRFQQSFGHPETGEETGLGEEIEADDEAVAEQLSVDDTSQALSPTPRTLDARVAFNPANVISDQNFYNGTAMTEAQIQSFLDQQGSSCTPSGNKKCLRSAKFASTRLTTARGACQPLTLTGNQSAAKIIAEVGKVCGLSPKVILSTIQKEQSAVVQPKTDAEFAKVMGSACPDGKPCDPAQAGFTKQVYFGADKLASYRINPTWEEYMVAFRQGKPITIQHNPDAACGSQSVKLQNDATASLYMYTPYIGNSTKAGCAAVGAKSFYDIYTRWFGSSTAPGTRDCLFKCVTGDFHLVVFRVGPAVSESDGKRV